MKMTPNRRALDKICRRRDRYEIPDWQREEVWPEDKKQKLIDSILRGWRLPKFYFALTNQEPEEFEVVDGQQRLRAIWQFRDNELTLPPDSSALTGGARRYGDLSDNLQDRFDDYEIDYDQVEEASEAELKEFFQRLQQALPLTSSEKLNAVHSNLTDFCRTLAAHSFFANKTTVSPKRLGYFDIVTKVAALQIDGIGASLRYDDLKKTFEAQKAFSDSSPVARRLVETFDTLDLIFPSSEKRLRNRTIVQSLSTFVADMSAIEDARDRSGEIKAFIDGFLSDLGHQVELAEHATDKSFSQFQKTINANVRSGPEIRQNLLIRKLIVHDPTFQDLFRTARVVTSHLDEEIGRLGAAIGSTVIQINDEHSATHGPDLFKMTNRTTSALQRLGKPIGNLDDYKRLVDDLYFLFYEGPGGRLDPKPEVFEDISLLRTDLSHDLDHGQPGKAARKRKKIGGTFSKYAGSPSPRTVAPERLPAIQGRILREVLAALECLGGAQSKPRT